MTTLSWISVILYVLLCIGAGRSFLFFMRFTKHPMLHNWAVCYLIGQMVVLFLTLLTAFTPVPLWLFQGLLVLVVSIAGALYGIRHIRDLAGLLFPVLAAMLVSVLLFPDLFLVTQYVPLYEWDARSYWFFHGKVIWQEGGIHASFFADPDYAWSHCDYPLFLASQAAWLSVLAGEWNDFIVKSFLWFNFTAYIDLFRRLLCRNCRRWWFWVPATVIMFHHDSISYVTGIADPHYAMPMILFLAGACIPAMATPMPFLAVMLAFAANMKNEASIYVGILAGAAMIKHFFWPLLNGQRKKAFAKCRDSWKSWALGLGLGGIPWLMWTVFRLFHHIPGRDQLFKSMLDGHTFMENLPQRTLPILSYFADNYSFRRTPLFIGIILLLIFIQRIQRNQQLEKSRLSLTLWPFYLFFVFANIFIFLPYIVTSFDLSFHLGTSAGRLLYLPFLMIILLLIENIRTLIPADDKTE